MALVKFPIEASHILMFARSVGDDNRVYADAGYARTTEAGGIIAPPTFVAAGAQFDPDNPMRPQPGKPWFGSGGTPSGDEGASSANGGLHAEQHYEYHRHLRPGDVLTSTTETGKSWEKEGRRSGKLIFTELITEYRDQNGELVITSRAVGVRPERPVDQR